MTFANTDIMEINDLLAVTADNITGYTEAKDKVAGSHFTPAFNERILERQSILTALESEVRRLGGRPGQGGTVLAGAGRMVANLKSAVLGRDDKAIIDQIERGEAYIKAKFETAMNNPDLSSQVAQVIRECFVTIKQGHDRMRDMKHAMEVASLPAD
ncbi:MAG: ferritin-like domain-containing protein [Erythrobacter sp.]